MKLNLRDFLKISCTDMMEKRVSCFEKPVKTKKGCLQRLLNRRTGSLELPVYR